MNLQRVLFLPAVSFVCPVVPTWLWDGEERQPLAASPALLTLLPAGTSTNVFLGLSNLCRTLSDPEAILTASRIPQLLITA